MYFNYNILCLNKKFNYNCLSSFGTENDGFVECLLHLYNRHTTPMITNNPKESYEKHHEHLES